MLTIKNGDVFKRIQHQIKELDVFLQTKAPGIIGKEAVDHFKENFQAESFEGVKWKEVQRRMPTINHGGKIVKNYARGAARSRKILTGNTGDLGRSIQYKVGSGKVTIYSNLIYAKVHNDGGHAGRGGGFTMPKRQFIGRSKKLDDIIILALNKHIHNIFNI